MRPSIRLRLAAWYTGLTTLTGLILLNLTLVFVVPALPTLMAYAKAEPGNPSASAASTAQSSNGVALQVVNVRARVGTSIITWGSLTLLTLALLSACMGWLLAGRVLRPVRAVTAAARGIAEGNLHERIASTGPSDELKELADTFDAMVARLERSFDGQRRFVANASHELRTPLTTARVVAEVAATAPNASPDARLLGNRLMSIAIAQERLLDSLLALAHDESTIDRSRQLDLAELAGEAIAAHAQDALIAGIEVRADLMEAPLLGDPALLTRVVHNLVDNAIRYNLPRGGWVTVRTGMTSERHAQLSITNIGSTIDQADASAMFEPFRRLRYDRATHPRGSGLGLSVVRAVAQAHHGTAVANPCAEGGLTVRVTIPAS